MYILLTAVILSFYISFQYICMKTSFYQWWTEGTWQLVLHIWYSYILTSTIPIPSSCYPPFSTEKWNEHDSVQICNVRRAVKGKHNEKSAPLSCPQPCHTHISFWKFSKSFSKVPLYISTSIKPQSACAWINSSFLVSSTLEQWISPRHAHIVFPNRVYVV